MNKQWIDISQPFSNKIGTWPGDTPFQFELAFSKEQTGSVNIGRFTTSVHTGTHADAPFHFDNDAPTIEQLDINIYIGRARVVDVTGLESIGREELQAFELDGVERLLLKTAKTVDVGAISYSNSCFKRRYWCILARERNFFNRSRPSFCGCFR